MENELKNLHSDVVTELQKQITDYKKIMNKENNVEERSQINRLITITEELSRDYQNYKKNNSLQGVSQLKAEVAAVVAYFNANGYKLSAELLTHARDYHNPDGLYKPHYGYLCSQSPVVEKIWANPNTVSGSDAFNKNAFSSTVTTDLYYSIHKFQYIKHFNINNSFLEIEDTYDYASGDYPFSIGGIAVELMYQAQEAGVLTPYLVYIKLTR